MSLLHNILEIRIKWSKVISRVLIVGGLECSLNKCFRSHPSSSFKCGTMPSWNFLITFGQILRTIFRRVGSPDPLIQPLGMQLTGIILKKLKEASKQRFITKTILLYQNSPIRKLNNNSKDMFYTKKVNKKSKFLPKKK